MFPSVTSDAPKRLTVFYDASCSVCDWEISHYKALQAKRPNFERIDFQDISRCAHQLNSPRVGIISRHICSDNHELLASRNITQEQALDYFHGINNSTVASNRRTSDAASAITPEGNVVKGAEVIVEMWKRLPVFHYVAPIFEGGLGSKVLSSGSPPNIWLHGMLSR
jgi:hypothetical protein